MPTIFKVFVDTNAFVALRDTKDSTHKRAKRILDKLIQRKAWLYTSSDVIGETLTVVSRKLGKPHAREFAREVEKMAEEIFISQEMHEKARKLFFKITSKNISFIDCSSAIAIGQAKIGAIFTFDKHFKSLGAKLIEDTL